MANFRRSFTHPISNTVVLNRLDIGKYLTDTLVGKFPVSQLPVVLHELTHHWCFASPVGTALSILAMGSRAGIVAAGNGVWPDHGDVCRSEVNYNFTMSMLQPLLEGMAEFAEFDLMPGNSRVASQLMSNVPIFFLQREQLGEQMLENFSNGLKRYRTDALFLERKKSLFTNSFDCTKSGYLAGYLFVKGMHGYTRFRTALFEDTDFFLLYIRSFFFDDWDFVRLLLERNTDPLESPELIMDYFIKRIQLFFMMDHNSSAARFEEEILGQKGVTYIVRFNQTIGHLFSCPVIAHKREDSLQTLMNEHISLLEKAGEAVPSQALLIEALLQYRDAITLGHAVMEARISEAGRLAIFNSDNHPLLSVAAPDNFKMPGNYALDVDTIFIREPPGLYVVFSLEGTIVHHLSLNQRELSAEQLLRYIGRNSIFGALGIWNDAANILQEDPEYMECHENALAYLELNLNNIYRMSAQIYTPEHQLDAAAKAMEECGIAEVVADEELLDKCIAASILYNNGISAASPKMQDLFQNRDLKSLTDELNSPILRKLGFNNFAYYPELGTIYSALF